MSEKIPQEIAERAAEWLMEMREPDIADSERAAFSEWLRASPMHVQAYLETASLWGDVSQVDKSMDFGIEQALRAGGAANVIPFETNVAPVAAREQVSASKRSRLAIAAAVLLALATGAGTWWHRTRLPTYSTDIGEQRVITLDDGSIVRLNARSAVRVNVTEHERNVELIAGQALFEVAKDPARPFIVESDDIAVRAVGTQFDVYRKDSGTIVTVVEGKVSVLRAAASTATLLDASLNPADGIFLSAGQQATITASAVKLHERANIDAATRWLQQELIFTDEPLSSVVEEFNRYSRKRIRVDDPMLAQFKINAVFRTMNPRSLLLYLERSEGIQVSETDSEIRITKK